eukprot:CAMPEP_0201095358 /NCGR_PEP_ID=MMETSP0812-20130820/4055_1 /ASSEMBLY_ACC=CAM_ASM_000668 /TAXON_ID=98059 /ORGANISM="Dinobryon sp., Strain UTEXLB2267" /LENGTH=220 /DNA_ID=CAMNT_0047348797 /DNA_START=21 /DNA_END=683 /DNA_ORIENTATION=-
MIAVDPVVLSAAFNEGNLPEFRSAGLPPVNDNELNTEVIRLKRRQAENIQDIITAKKLRHDSSGHVTIEDEKQVNEYLVKSIALETLPVIQRNLNFPQTIGNEIAQAIQPLTNQVAALTAQLAAHGTQLAAHGTQLAALTVQMRNSTAEHLEDDIFPPPHGAAPPPANFPRTVAGLVGLHPGPHLVAIENYYELAHTGDLTTRIRRLRREYGVRTIVVLP